MNDISRPTDNNNNINDTTTTTTTDILSSLEQLDDEEEGSDSLIHLPLHWQQERGRKLIPSANGDDKSRGTIRNNIKRNTHSSSGEDLSLDDERKESAAKPEHNTNMNKKMLQRKLQEITGVATQYVNVYVGTPAQKRTLAISTGADFTAFPCQVNAYFHWSLSVLKLFRDLVSDPRGIAQHFRGLNLNCYSLFLLCSTLSIVEYTGMYRMWANHLLVLSIPIQHLHHSSLWGVCRGTTQRRHMRRSSDKV